MELKVSFSVSYEYPTAGLSIAGLPNFPWAMAIRVRAQDNENLMV